MYTRRGLLLLSISQTPGWSIRATTIHIYTCIEWWRGKTSSAVHSSACGINVCSICRGKKKNRKKCPRIVFIRITINNRPRGRQRPEYSLLFRVDVDIVILDTTSYCDQRERQCRLFHLLPSIEPVEMWTPSPMHLWYETNRNTIMYNKRKTILI